MVVKSQHKKNSIINVEQVCDDCGVEFCDGRHCPLFEYDSHCRTEPEVRFLFKKNAFDFGLYWYWKKFMTLVFEGQVMNAYI